MRPLGGTIVAALLVVSAGAASAQPLFVEPGAQRAVLVATTSDPFVGPWLGMDRAGYVYAGQPGYLACWHPDDPVASKVTLRPTWTQEGAFLPFGMVATAMDPAHDGVLLFGWRHGPTVPTTFKTGRFRCADHEGGIVDDTRFDTFTTLDEVTTTEAVPAWLGGDNLVVDPAGDLCRLVGEGLWCARVRSGGVTFERVIDVEEVVAAIDVDPALGAPVASGAGGERPQASWTLRLPTFLADGRVLVIAQVSYTSGAASWGPFAWLLERTPAGTRGDGTWRVRVSPPRPLIGSTVNRDDTLQLLNLLTEVDGLDAIVGWPLRRTAWSAEVVRDTEAGPVVAGGVGVGAWLLPEDPRASTATWDWTQALGDVFRCTPSVDQIDGCPEGGGRFGVDGDKLAERFERVHTDPKSAIRLPDGLGVATLAGVDPDSGAVLRGLARLTWDEAALDLDRDGVARGDEAARGTSDWVRESVAPRPPPTYWAESRLVEWFLPDLDGYAVHGGYGPMCHRDAEARFECRPAHDDIVDYGVFQGGDDAERIERVWPSQDGTYLVVWRADGLVRIDHATGHERRLVDAGTIDQALAALPASTGWSTELVVVPATRDTIFVAVTTVNLPEGDVAIDDAHIFVVDGGALRLVYDHGQARCDSGLGPCGAPLPAEGLRRIPPNDLSVEGYGTSGLHIAGWLPGAERLVVAVLLRYGRVLVGVHPTEPPTVLRYGADLAFGAGLDGLPRFVVSTGHGASFVTGPSSGLGFVDAWGAPIPTLIERAGPWGEPPIVVPPGHLGLGDRGVMFTLGVPTGAGRALYENVPYDPNEADPGDVFTIVNEVYQDDLGTPRDARWRLFRSGPRGGLVPAWSFALSSVELRGPTGMDVNARGLLCIADRHDGRLRVFEPFASSLLPSAPLFDYALDEGAVDCLVEPDDTVWVLQDRPARVARYQLFVDEPLEVVELTATDPVGLVRTPDGGFEVLDRAAGELGRVHRADGTRFDADASACTGGAAPWRVFVVERADRRLVVNCLVETESGLVTTGGPTMVVDPVRGALPLSSNETASRQLTYLLARLPGGAAVDPWTGDALDPEDPSVVVPPGIVAPDPPVGGEPVAGAGPSGDGGCSGGPASSPVAMLIAIIGLLWRRPPARVR